MKPRIVKQIINADTGNTTNIEPIEVRRVVSKKTSAEMRNIMESVATIGTGKAARVTGYSVGGKSGTSEPVVGKEGEDGYIASYIAIAPTEKPEICILVALYGVPKSARYQGGQIAAPVVSSILTEVLPSLGIPSDGTDILENENDKDSIITLPDITNKTVAEAEKILKDLGLTPQTSQQSKKDEKIVNSQNPKPGTTIRKGSIIKVYTADDNVKISQEVPNLKEMSAAQAKNALTAKNLNIETHGSGVVITQEPAAGSAVEEGSIVSVNLGDDLKYAY